MRRGTAAAAVSAAALAPVLALASPAAAAQKIPIEDAALFVVNDLCPFTVNVDASVVGHLIVVEREDGSVIQRIHLTETDTFQAADGGPTVTGTYTFNTKVTIDPDGNVVKGAQTGTIVKIRLPDGTTFKVAGYADTLTAASDYIAVPTHGVTKNLDGLCDYLAG